MTAPQITRTEIEPVGLSDVDDLTTELGGRNKPMLSYEDSYNQRLASLEQRQLNVIRFGQLGGDDEKIQAQLASEFTALENERRNYYPTNAGGMDGVIRIRPRAESMMDLGIISGTGPDGVAPAQGRSFFGDVANAAGRGWNIAQSVASWRWNTVTSDYNQLANWTNNASDKIWNAYQQSSIGQALQGTGFIRWAENQRVRLPTYTTAGNAWQRHDPYLSSAFV
jgi:hypothetical protein